MAALSTGSVDTRESSARACGPAMLIAPSIAVWFTICTFSFHVSFQSRNHLSMDSAPLDVVLTKKSFGASRATMPSSTMYPASFSISV